jgi:hypothetical protein
VSADILKRIERLIALAASDNENEARNAAVTACRLIRDHKVHLVLEGAPTGTRVGDVHHRTRPATADQDFADLWNTIFRGAAEKARQQAREAAGNVRPPPRPQPMCSACGRIVDANEPLTERMCPHCWRLRRPQPTPKPTCSMCKMRSEYGVSDDGFCPTCAGTVAGKAAGARAAANAAAGAQQAARDRAREASKARSGYHCPRCGVAAPAGVTEGTCPACMDALRAAHAAEMRRQEDEAEKQRLREIAEWEERQRRERASAPSPSPRSVTIETATGDVLDDFAGFMGGHTRNMGELDDELRARVLRANRAEVSPAHTYGGSDFFSKDRADGSKVRASDPTSIFDALRGFGRRR